MLLWIGALILLLAIVAIIKEYDAKLVLFLAGLAMTLAAGKWDLAFTTFSNAMLNKGLVPVVCSVMGFAYVMKLTECDKHLVYMMVSCLKRFKMVLIPGAVIITFLVNIALPTAAGCAAAVGIVLIPVLIKAGVHPIIAAATILGGTWGSVLNPGTVHNPFIAKLAGSDPMSVVMGHAAASFAGVAVIAVGLYLIAKIKGEDSGYISKEEVKADDEGFELNMLKAMVPLFPLALLILGSKQIALIPNMSVLQTMILGVFLGFAVTRKSPQQITKEYFKGMGDAYGNVIGLIVAAAVLIAGMQSLGIVESMIAFMKGSQGMAKIAAAWGPWAITVISGSGDAATLAFNGAITPFAKDFGLDISQLGSLAYLSGGLGRSMCPVAPVSIICATLAGVNPMDMVKRNAIPVILAVVVVMFML